jgi:methyltransferase (TIGR00027 family)
MDLPYSDYSDRHIIGTLFHEKRTLMQDGKASQTAQYITFCRALETQEQPARRFFDDPYAFALLSDSYRMFARLARLPIIGKLVYAILNLGWPYSRSSAVVRTRAIDDLVRDAIRNGARQLVLLGAGLDSRGCRLDETEDVAVFEVDHPATQDMKKERLHACMGKLPANVRYVAVDFERDALEVKLIESGYDPAVQAVVVWEGVIDYLTESAVQSTLAVLARLLAPSSLLIFTYTDKGALDGSKAFRGARRWRSLSKAGGEPFLFGYNPDTLAEVLKPYRLQLESDASTEEIAQCYCSPLARTESGNRAYRVATARRMEP